MFNVLIVDDDLVVLECLTKFINWPDLGFRIVGTALSSAEAVSMLEVELVDVILTDIVMPGRDGLDLIREAMEINPYIKTVILSSHIDFKYAKEAMKLGSVDYITKPVDFEELKSTFSKLKLILDHHVSERKKGYIKESMSIISENQGKPMGIAIELVTKYINEHYSEDITLQKLSEIAYMHPIYLCRVFKEKMGENFMDYLIKVRIEKAKSLLGDLSLRIYDVCEMVGYDSPQHFSKVFKEVTGLAPKDYRKNCHV